MRVDDFDYELPSQLIAQTPLEKRSDSRLMIVDRFTGNITHEYFYNIYKFLNHNDVLVLNDTKVMPSRIFGKKIDTQATIEFLLLKEKSKDIYEALVKPARRVKVGTVINFQNILTGKIIEKFTDGRCLIEFSYQGIFLERLEELGEMPLPPYIHQKLEDQNRYQTVYARTLGSAAAPTAGLHFTPELLTKLQNQGVKIVYVTLHVGLGTFKLVNVDFVEEHKMHSEFFRMDQKTAEILNEAKANKKRIISVGTTSARTLEAIYNKYQKFIATSEETNIFIYPGYEFKAIDALITNFHLPKSTLIMLVSAFASREIILNCYQEAIKEKYRFFSFGDAMLIK